MIAARLLSAIEWVLKHDWELMAFCVGGALAASLAGVPA